MVRRGTVGMSAWIARHLEITKKSGSPPANLDILRSRGRSSGEPGTGRSDERCREEPHEGRQRPRRVPVPPVERAHRRVRPGGTPVLLLTVPGRKRGTLHTTPVSYFEDQGGYVVTGTAGGTKQAPPWFRNLRAASRAHVELGPRHLDVDVHVASGAERDRLWREVVLARAPSFAAYEEKSGRVIPVAVLTPV